MSENDEKDKTSAFDVLKSCLTYLWNKIPEQVKKRIGKNIKKHPAPFALMILIWVVAFALLLINNRKGKQPEISCYVDMDQNEIKCDAKAGEEVTGIWIRLHPQLTIRYEYGDEDIYMAQIYFKNFLEEESGFFEDGTLTFKIQHKLEAERLSRAFLQSIETEIKNDEQLKASDFIVSLSFVGGVRFLVNGDMEEHSCVVEHDKLVFNRKEDNKEIGYRLYETSLDLKGMERSQTVPVVETYTKEIIEGARFICGEEGKRGDKLR